MHAWKPNVDGLGRLISISLPSFEHTRTGGRSQDLRQLASARARETSTPCPAAAASRKSSSSRAMAGSSSSRRRTGLASAAALVLGVAWSSSCSALAFVARPPLSAAPDRSVSLHHTRTRDARCRTRPALWSCLVDSIGRITSPFTHLHRRAVTGASPLRPPVRLLSSPSPLPATDPASTATSSSAAPSSPSKPAAQSPAVQGGSGGGGLSRGETVYRPKGWDREMYRPPDDIMFEVINASFISFVWFVVITSV